MSRSLTCDDLSPGLQEALAIFVNRTPLAISTSLCLEHPDLFLALSDKQQESLIEQTYKVSMLDKANELCQLRFSAKPNLKKCFEQFKPPVSPSIAELNAQCHPMRNVLSTLKTAMNLLGLADEQLLIASDQLSDIATSANNSGLDIADIDLIDDASLEMQDMFDKLAELSHYFRAKAGMV